MWWTNVYSHVPSCSSLYKHFLCQLDTSTWFWAKLKLATLDSNLHLHRWVEELCKRQGHWGWALRCWTLVHPILMGGVWPPRKMAVLSNSVWVDGPLPQRLRVAHWVVSGQGRDRAGLHWQELEKENNVLKDLFVRPFPLSKSLFKLTVASLSVMAVSRTDDNIWCSLSSWLSEICLSAYWLSCAK